ncbi:2,4-dichlorophenol 6-monooxygenase [Pigmentiphaga humi]|uniref:2,4-dichlorophenol 6-monooxygenase n=1 Tax=Pigmentiphaga humi TaxID=2478468 RepID=A0A3P4B7K6_9BURK|nr:FAD-dependent oxidoreductase [Pigmentiphaga humi]VCU71496.1 2,4-dichlorophenol 6-monooxygenase [Pigmentiphaga humi]
MHLQTEVLVIGAGPVGLALAGDLGWRGRQCLVVERGDGVIGQPRMDLVGLRTMEYCRRWGLVGEVEASPYDRDYPQDNVYLTSLNGYELERQPMPSMRDEPAPPESPQHRERCPQNMFDPILCRFARSQPSVELLYRHEFLSFEQDGDGVTAKIADLATGAEKTIRARFLVGCDGARSAVRTQLGIDMQGRGLLTNTTNVIFRCPEFNRLHDKKPGYRYMFVGPDGIWATIVAINGNDQWRMSIIGNARERPEYTNEEIEAFAHRALGRPFDLEILSVLRWARMELVADRYHEGRVFICGDACHLTSPTGGLGMNTGIGDAVTLSWKLAAHLEGWGGPGLLEAYGIERRPIAKRITAFSTENLRTMKQVPTSEKLFDDGPEGAEARARAGRALAEGLRQEWFSMNIHLGNRYTGSPVIVYSEPEDPQAIQAEFDDAIHYRPTSRPGCRAPHAWLQDGRSTLDLFGRHFVLLDFGGPDAASHAFTAAARAAGVPVEHVRLAQPEIASRYEKRFVLVRPDGHVAWRGDAIPEDAQRLLATVTGHQGD